MTQSVFHAGTQTADDGSGAVLTAGGRVLACVGLGDSLADARTKAYARISSISFEGAYYRRDIAAESIRPAGGHLVRLTYDQFRSFQLVPSPTGRACQIPIATPRRWVS